MSDTEQLTREKAEECLAAVREWLAASGDQWAADNAKLYEPGFHCTGWAIALEGGPEEWPWLVSQEVGEEGWPEGVFAEPGSSWYLGLYVEWSPRPKPVRYPACEVELLGADANAVAIIMRVRRALIRHLTDKEGMTRQEAEAKGDQFRDEARSGDYENVLATCHRWVSVS